MRGHQNVPLKATQIVLMLLTYRKKIQISFFLFLQLLQ